MTARGARDVQQLHPGLLWSAPALLRVAATATGHHVLPGVGSALGLGHHVIDILGTAAAVLTPVAVSHEDCAAIERHPAGVRHLDKMAESDHRR